MLNILLLAALAEMCRYQLSTPILGINIIPGGNEIYGSQYNKYYAGFYQLHFYEISFFL